MALPHQDVVKTLFYWQFGAGQAPTVIVLVGDVSCEIGTEVPFTLPESVTYLMRVVREVRVKDLQTAMRAYIAIFAGVQHPMLLQLKGHLDAMAKVEADFPLHAYLIEPV